ncbi:tyrosine-type recombinase/integrase [Neptuniibacter sp. QD37_11]|uniref:tyrosine-type recombinase/integrase n=1 Tax=Neptuniibacter sp. QD37_11 TaxID=3398209 RepID=UPI0039F5EED2
MPLKPNRARALYPKEIKHALKVAGVCQNPLRNQLVLLLSHCCGLRITEIALLRVRDVLYSSGALRKEIQLPASITKSNRTRLVWLHHKNLQRVLDQWVMFRAEKKLGTKSHYSRYRGLNPDSKLVLSNRGSGFSLQPKKRLLDTGEIRTYWASDSLEQAMRNLYKKCGLVGCSSHSGRRSFATNLICLQDVELDVVARLLGHSDPAHTIPYIEVRAERVKAMYACALD